ncbi:AER088Cp [Eremothecium gossypii ATCC 10895]|uniref:AER088Cp n=1 Tax=Eremothecium gossypii (strain ATCC 10895 / CBS 109.51 / FGSC 9923 / NRRL Y-1056) TaxID=284811 RepID=Q757C5_EREGS|nr:AER088Cp [Eremothecium gossypii ATCC 10895]AAS52772.2 AER088Cp [Eremothecium gossypii ATCC 10895]AEY97078.1 FAER088Cp [Eremothecium gossypii FDAG1]
MARIVPAGQPVASAGSELRRKWSLGDLMLPSLQAARRPALAQESPYFFDVRGRAASAPSSPQNATVLTPTTSPRVQSLQSSPQVSLPPLRHLRLLPNPDRQQHAPAYPDTCEHTHRWRHDLVRWCAEAKREHFKHIEAEMAQLDVRSFPGLHMLANAAYVSSIVSPRDHFFQLADSSASEWIVMTPPVSPREEGQQPASPGLFTHAVSEKLVQTIRRKRLSASSHKKSNSFQAREMKKLLDSRSNLAPSGAGKISKKLPAAPVQQLMATINLGCSQQPECCEPPNLTPQRPAADLHPTRSIPCHQLAQLVRTPMGPRTPSRRASMRRCLSCHCTESPCWRPSWSDRRQDQLCNSCGLRYKKTHTRCLNSACRRIPSKGELAQMKTNPIVSEILENGLRVEGLRCLFCNCVVETRD